MIATVVGLDDVISVTPTLDTNAYASGDRLGSIQTITNPFRSIHRANDLPVASAGGGTVQPRNGRVILSEVTLLDQAKQSQPIDLLFFDSSPTVASADNAPIDISDAEMAAKFIGSVSIGSTYVALAGNSVSTDRNLNMLLKQNPSATDNNIYVVAVIRGSATFTASSLIFSYKFYQD
mgnify:CR=1 FL=1